MKLLSILLIVMTFFIPLEIKRGTTEESATCPGTHEDNLAVLEAFITELDFKGDRQTYGLDSATEADIVPLTDQNYSSVCSTLNKHHSSDINKVTAEGYQVYKHTFYKVKNRYVVTLTAKEHPVENHFNLSLNAVFIYNSSLNYLGGVSY